jgi:benzil reductase ((S)-benzoin forming)
MEVDRLAIVTGGSKGLGRELCAQLQAQGFDVRELSRSAPHPHSVQVDLSRPLESAQAIQQALTDVDLHSIREFICISNAATVGPIGPASGQTPESMLRSLHVNLVSSIVAVTAVMALLEDIAARKVLVNITSGAAQTAHAGLSLYGAAKAGMEQFVRTVAVEQGSRRYPFIAVSVDPGSLDTEMQSQLRASRPEDYPAVAEFVRRHERAELASPAAVAATIVQIARSEGLISGVRYHVRDADPGTLR